ncbi:MAG: STAS-like domain-containing protein, partial [Shimia sp.]
MLDDTLIDQERTIRVASDFSQTPGGRYRRHGPYSGEEFRMKHLVPALKAAKRVVIEFDGVDAYPVSFTEEAFGGLVREGFSFADLQKRLKLLT